MTSHKQPNQATFKADSKKGSPTNTAQLIKAVDAEAKDKAANTARGIVAGVAKSVGNAGGGKDSTSSSSSSAKSETSGYGHR